MKVFDLCVKYYYWEYIIKRNFPVQKIKVKKYILNFHFL